MSTEQIEPTPLERAQKQLRRIKRTIRRRSDDIAKMKAQIAILREELKSPIERTVGSVADPEVAIGAASYSLSARMHRRHNTTGVNVREGLHEPILQLYAKTDAQRFAALHGIRVPKTLGRWPNPDAVDWDALPDRFVLKSNIGGGGINVYPLVRDTEGDGYTDMLTKQPTTRDEVTQKLWSKHQDRSFYFAEEFLTPRGAKAGSMPHDIKVFCFYGEPAYIEVRTGDWSRAKDITQQVRTFAADGTELFHVRGLIEGGADLDPPADFTSVVEASSRLSQAIRRPLERLDFFETDDGLVFGEVTQNPGRPPALVPEWDRRLGEAYEDAYARLLGDLASEGALHVEFGDADDGSA